MFSFISDRKGKGDKEIETSMIRLAASCTYPQLVMEPATRPCGPTRNQTATSWFTGKHSVMEPDSWAFSFFEMQIADLNYNG